MRTCDPAPGFPQWSAPTLAANDRERQYASSRELAKAEKVNDSYVSRIPRLTLIAPDVFEATVAGRQPSTLQFDELLKPLSAAWDRQCVRARIR